MEKRILDRRLALMEAEGVVFRAGVHVGVDVSMKRLQSDLSATLLDGGAGTPRALSVQRLRSDFAAILLAGGAGQPRALTVPGRDLRGIPFAMEFLTLQNR